MADVEMQKTSSEANITRSGTAASVAEASLLHFDGDLEQLPFTWNLSRWYEANKPLFLKNWEIVIESFIAVVIGMSELFLSSSQGVKHLTSEDEEHIFIPMVAGMFFFVLSLGSIVLYNLAYRIPEHKLYKNDVGPSNPACTECGRLEEVRPYLSIEKGTVLLCGACSAHMAQCDASDMLNDPEAHANELAPVNWQTYQERNVVLECLKQRTHAILFAVIACLIVGSMLTGSNFFLGMALILDGIKNLLTYLMGRSEKEMLLHKHGQYYKKWAIVFCVLFLLCFAANVYILSEFVFSPQEDCELYSFINVKYGNEIIPNYFLDSTDTGGEAFFPPSTYEDCPDAEEMRVCFSPGVSINMPSGNVYTALGDCIWDHTTEVL